MVVGKGQIVLFIQLAILAVLLIFSFHSDIKKSIIPNKYVVIGAISGLLYNVVAGGLEGLFFSLKGLGVGFGILLFLYLFGAIGAGDVKLFGAIGAIMGTEFVIVLIINSVVLACIIGIILIAVNGELPVRLKNLFYSIINFFLIRERKVLENYKYHGSFRFPFMYAVLPAVILTYLSLSFI